MERCLPADRANVRNNTIFWAGTPADFAIPQSEGDSGHEFNGQRGAPHQDASASMPERTKSMIAMWCPG